MEDNAAPKIKEPPATDPAVSHATAGRIRRGLAAPTTARYISIVTGQLTASANQTKELFELSAKIAQQTFETMNAAAAKTFEQMKKSA